MLERARSTYIMINHQNFDNAQISPISWACWRWHSRIRCSRTSNTSEFDRVLQALHWCVKRSCRKTRLKISWLTEPGKRQKWSQRYFILLCSLGDFCSPRIPAEISGAWSPSIRIPLSLKSWSSWSFSGIYRPRISVADENSLPNKRSPM
jgi:hypothetical protein